MYIEDNVLITIAAVQLYYVLNSSVDHQGIKFSADKVIKATVNLPKVGEK